MDIDLGVNPSPFLAGSPERQPSPPAAWHRHARPGRSRPPGRLLHLGAPAFRCHPTRRPPYRMYDYRGGSMGPSPIRAETPMACLIVRNFEVAPATGR